MEMISRDSCVVSGQKDLELLHCFEDFPVHMGCVNTPPTEDLSARMAWWISRTTGSIQLNPLVPLEVLYGQGHGSGTVGELWRRHHKAFCEFALRYQPRHVVEIGGGHGCLANEYLDVVPDAQWTMVEPNPTVAARDRLRVVRGLVDEHYQADATTDAILHSHLLEHIYEPSYFVGLVAKNLPENGYHLFSIPNLRLMLERNYTNCLDFEHTVFLSEEYIDYLLTAAGFMIHSKEYFLDDHSIFYATRKSSDLVPHSLPRLYEWHRELFQDYVSFHQVLAKDLNQRISSHSGEVFVFGAHVFTQYLIAFGLDTGGVVSILDNDPNKQGRRLYGTQLRVEPPSVLRQAANPALVLRGGVYNEEIKAGIRNTVASPVIYWE